MGEAPAFNVARCDASRLSADGRLGPAARGVLIAEAWRAWRVEEANAMAAHPHERPDGETESVGPIVSFQQSSVGSVGRTGSNAGRIGSKRRNLP